MKVFLQFLVFFSLFSQILFSAPKEFVPGEVIVKFKDSHTLRSIDNFAIENNLTTKNHFPTINAVHFKSNSRMTTDSLMSVFSKMEEIEYVEPNYIYRITGTPNDPSYSSLYGMSKIQAESAWAISTGSKTITVAVIDTGVDHTHEDLKDNIKENPGEIGTDADGKDKRSNGIDDDGNGFVDDWHGWDFANGDNDPMDDHMHGSHCSGSIGATGNNGVGVVGVNWNVSILPIKFLTGSGSGTLDNALKSIQYATLMKVDVMSNSWGGGGHSQAMKDAIEEANKAGILFVAAAGNDRSNNDTNPSYPASYKVDNVVSVAASDSNDKKAGFSNYGKTTVHLAAPGVNILSTSTENKYESISGTSMATPHVAGVGALIKSVYPNASVEELKSRLVSTVDPLPEWKDIVSSGGRLNAFNSLENDSIAPAAISDLKVVSSGIQSITVEWSSVGDDGLEGSASHYDVRYYNEPISEDNWKNAKSIAVTGLDIVSDTLEQTLTSLDFNSTYYIAVRAYDNVGNASELSNLVEGKTANILVLFEDSFEEANDAWSAESPWKIIDSNSDEGNVWTDSPDGNYDKNINTSLTFNSTAPIEFNDDAYLSFRTNYDTEKNYDRLHIELKNDDGTWVTLKSLHGRADWNHVMLNITDHIKELKTLSIRFRLQSDSIIHKDGVYINDFKLITKAPSIFN